MPNLSIIIPTRKRPIILEKCLQALAQQTCADQLEVIVVHDGEDDEETRVMLSSLAGRSSESEGWSKHGLSTNYFSIPKSQQGVARNRGVEKATAPIVLFIGDDIFLAPDACERHLSAHTKHEARSTKSETNLNVKIQNSNFNIPSDFGFRISDFAVLGFTTWDPACDINGVMRWLEKTGWQFGYPLIAKYAGMLIPEDRQERFTYTSHISVPLQTAKKFPFNEDARLYGWEDIVWGKNLKEDGIPLFYEPAAKALHHHHITPEQSLKRMETLGRSLRQVTAANPTLGRMPTGWKRVAYRLLALTPTMRGKHYAAFLRGIDGAL